MGAYIVCALCVCVCVLLYFAYSFKSNHRCNALRCVALRASGPSWWHHSHAPVDRPAAHCRQRCPASQPASCLCLPVSLPARHTSNPETNQSITAPQRPPACHLPPPGPPSCPLARNPPAASPRPSPGRSTGHTGTPRAPCRLGGQC